MNLFELLQHTLLISLYGIPESFTFLTFSFVFWGRPLARKTLLTVLLFAALTSIGTIGMAEQSPFVHTVIFGAVFYVLFQIIFFKLRWRERLLIPFFAHILMLMLESVLLTVVMALSPGGMAGGLLLRVLILYPVFSAVLWISWKWHKKQIYPGQALMYLWSSNKNSMLLTILVLFQMLVVILVMSYSASRLSDGYWLMTACSFNGAIISSVVVLYLHFRSAARAKEQASSETQLRYAGAVNRMFTKLRGQRHDFINHIQVIQMLMKSDQPSELRRYAMELFEEMADTEKYVGSGVPILTAVLQDKKREAELREIDYCCDIEIGEPLGLDDRLFLFLHLLETLIENLIEEIDKSGESGWSMEIRMNAADHKAKKMLLTVIRAACAKTGPKPAIPQGKIKQVLYPLSVHAKRLDGQMNMRRANPIEIQIAIPILQ